MNSPFNNIVIVGGGIIAWWAAVFLKKTNPLVNITLVQTRVSETYAETSEPEFSYLLKLIGLSIQDLLRYADGNFYCAQAYFDWPSDTPQYFHSTQVTGLDYELASYNQWLTKLKQVGKKINLDDYLLASVAAKEGKIALSDTQKIIHSGLSFDSQKLTELLILYAKNLHVNVVGDAIKQVHLADDGAITSIALENNTQIAADFFIDATGIQSTLLGESLKIGFESWAAYLPCNRKKSIKSKPRSERLIPFTAIQLGRLGWVKNTPLRSQLVAEFVYADSMETAEPKDEIFQLFSASETQIFSPGMRKKTWFKNCLALGQAAVSFDHFSHSSLYVAAVALKRFTEFWPSSPTEIRVEAEYNRLMQLEYEAIRDFHCLHYILVKRTDSHFSKLLSEISLPDSLRYRIDLFDDCGHASTHESTLVEASQWTNLFLGFGRWPKTCDYLISHVSVDSLEQLSEGVKTNIQKHVLAAPEYTPYVTSLMSAR